MHTLIVIPCYNEAERLSPHKVDMLLADPRIGMLFVNDGSQDRTQALLLQLAAVHPERVEIMDFAVNRGKAEAVRLGLLRALDVGATLLGFTDADFSTPPAEILRLIDKMEYSDAEIVLGSRVRLLGTAIQRSLVRHLAGRIFATVASLAVGAPIYDTQCGAKFFRVTGALQAALAQPFSSRWSFDVELLCRLFGRLESSATTSVARAIELPLREWCDVGGSKLDFASKAKSFLELLVIWARAERHSRKR
jgi:dolichyl-phosphate beta-glucosyltransferase